MANARGLYPLLHLGCALILVAPAILAGASPGATSEPTDADFSLAESLLRKHEIPLDESLQVVGVYDSSTEIATVTSVWCSQSYKGLPVFDGEIAYHFRTFRKSGGRTEVSTSGTRIDSSNLKIRTTPTISERDAIDLFLEQSGSRDEQNHSDRSGATAILGILNKMGGVGSVEPIWLLAWRVSGSANYPYALFDAQTGELYRFDDGVRY